MKISISITELDEIDTRVQIDKINELIKKFYPFILNEITGSISNTDVDLKLMCKYFNIEFNGRYDSAIDEMPTDVLVIRKGMIPLKWNINWHPFDGLGGFADYEFEKQVLKLYNMIRHSPIC